MAIRRTADRQFRFSSPKSAGPFDGQPRNLPILTLAAANLNTLFAVICPIFLGKTRIAAQFELVRIFTTTREEIMLVENTGNS
jgi:hypothetical protein